MKVLMIGSLLTINGGIQRYIQNLLLHMDTQKYQIDLLATPAPAGQPDNRAVLEQAGVRVLWMPDGDKKRLFFYHRFLRENPDYDLIHMHTTSKVNALSACIIKASCPGAKLIVHSHTVYPPLTWVWRAAHKLYRRSADYFLACSVGAGEFVFGAGIQNKPNFSIACNAVDKTRFCPNAAARDAVRTRYGVGPDEKLAGFVGRYNHGKNILFTLEVFAALCARSPGWKLMLVGGGEDQAQVDARIAALGLGERVIQTGVQSDIPAFMNAFDAFLLPSHFEGSPVTLVEAQGCGVYCFASTNVPPDSAVTGLVRFLPLAEGAEAWAKAIDRVPGGAHEDHWAQLAAGGYELCGAAKAMEALYDKLG